MAETVILTCPPGALDKSTAAAYCAVGVSTFERMVQARKAPQPRMFPAKRVVWLRTDLDSWLQGLPISNILPPENTGEKKPRKTKAQITAQKAAPSAHPA